MAGGAEELGSTEEPSRDADDEHAAPECDDDMSKRPMAGGAELGSTEEPSKDADDEHQAPDCDDDMNKSFAEILGPHCTIQRVDKDKNVIGKAEPDEMQREMLTRASAQKRLGAVADHVKDMPRAERLSWALDLKDRGNEFYASSNFDEAAKLYNDCLCALDLEGSEAENLEVQTKLQLPVCTNLAACMIEMGRYEPCIEICDIALSVDPNCPKALYRRGLSHYRLGDHASARPDFEEALHEIQEMQQTKQDDPAELRSLQDLQRRLTVYMTNMRRFRQHEKERCQKAFNKPIYPDRPDAKFSDEAEEPFIDDSDEALEAAVSRARGDWCTCKCRKRKPSLAVKQKTE